MKKKSVNGSRIDRRVGTGTWQGEDAGKAKMLARRLCPATLERKLVPIKGFDMRRTSLHTMVARLCMNTL